MTHPFAVGDVVLAAEIPGFSELAGQQVTVEAVEQSGAYTHGYVYRATFIDPHQTGDKTRSQSLNFGGGVLVEASHGETDPKDTRIAELEKLLADEQARLAEAQRRYVTDFTTCNRLANDEADRQNYCSQYEDFLEKMTDAMVGGYAWEGRATDTDLGWDEKYIVTVRRYGTASMRNDGSVEDEARQLNDDEDATSDQILEAVRNGNYDAHGYVPGSAFIDN